MDFAFALRPGGPCFFLDKKAAKNQDFVFIP